MNDYNEQAARLLGLAIELTEHQVTQTMLRAVRLLRARLNAGESFDEDDLIAARTLLIDAGWTVERRKPGTTR